MKQRLYGKNLKVLIITLIILTVLGVLSQAENSLLSSGVNTLTKGLFQLSALATASADSATREELLKENEELKKENAALRGQLADYIDTKAENEKLWAYYELTSTMISIPSRLTSARPSASRSTRRSSPTTAWLAGLRRSTPPPAR